MATASKHPFNRTTPRTLDSTDFTEDPSLTGAIRIRRLLQMSGDKGSQPADEELAPYLVTTRGELLSWEGLMRLNSTIAWVEYAGEAQQA